MSPEREPIPELTNEQNFLIESVEVYMERGLTKSEAADLVGIKKTKMQLGKISEGEEKRHAEYMEKMANFGE